MRSKAVRPVDPTVLAPVAPAVVALQPADALRTAGRELLGRAVAALEAELKSPLRCEARLLHAPFARASLSSNCSLVLSLSQTGEYALLEIEEATAAALVDRLAGGRSGPFAPGVVTHAEAAALGYLGLVALDTVRGTALFEQALAVRLACVARSLAEAEAIFALEECWIAVDLALELPGARGAARLLLPSRALLRLAKSSPSAPSLPGPRLGAVALRATLLAGHAELFAEEIARLGPGDAVLVSGLERTDAGLTGPCLLEFEGFHLRGRIAGHAFTFASAEDAALPPEFPMNAPKPPPLPIQVEVELARVNVPLSQLGRLEPGAVIELGACLQDPVLLRVGDRSFARAELVDVGGELGARIIELLA